MKKAIRLQITSVIMPVNIVLLFLKSETENVPDSFDLLSEKKNFFFQNRLKEIMYKVLLEDV